jgi:hypothetical protein
MCEFISWIEKDGHVLFLTANDIFNTQRGKELREYCQNRHDWIGHGAIRFYYQLENGVERECTDFSSTNNFPAEIVSAIKSGAFRGLGTPCGLLNEQAYAEYKKIKQSAYAEYKKIQQAYAEYEKIQQSALAEYEKIQQSAWAEYKKIKQSAYAEYEKIAQALAEYKKIEQPAYAEYKKIQQPAWAEYKKIEQPALTEYQKICQDTFWNLFADINNRAECWK